MKKFLQSLLVGLSILALTAPAFAAEMEGQEHSTSTPRKPQVDLVCMVSAVSTRETGLGSAFDMFATAEKSALATRATALKSAWAMTDAKERRKALRAAWSDYRKARKTAARAYKETVRKTWNDFKNAARVCHGNGNEEGASHDDESLG